MHQYIKSFVTRRWWYSDDGSFAEAFWSFWMHRL